MKSIKVGLIGTGYIGLVHLEMLRRLVGAEVLAVADKNRELPIISKSIEILEPLKAGLHFL